MELDLPKAQGKVTGKGRKSFNMNNHKKSWKNKCRGRKKNPQQPNNSETDKTKNKIHSKIH